MDSQVFPEDAIAAIRKASWDEHATWGIEGCSGTPIWSDENYVDFVCACAGVKNWSYWDPVLCRLWLITGQENPARPLAECRRAWEELKKRCPDWPGFRPERCSDALRTLVES